MATIPGTLNTQLTDEQVLEAFDNALKHTPSDSTPKEDGSGSAGEEETFARSDHEHPHDSTKQDTLAFEGTYNASTNKAATMSALKDGKLTGYAQASGDVAATDKIIEAIGKVEKKADDNKNNISWGNNYGYKNLINVTRDSIKAANPTLIWTDYTVANHGGLSFTVNPDLSITISGTTTSQSLEFNILRRADGKTIFKEVGNYRIDGKIQAGKGMLAANRTVSGSGVRYGADEGATATFDVSQSDLSAPVGVWYGINEGVGVSVDMTIYPMICLSTMDRKYQPYALSNAELTAKEQQNENNISAVQTDTALLKNTITTIRFASGTSRTFQFTQRTNYHIFMVFGFVQGVGLVSWTCKIDNTGTLKVFDTLANTEVSQSTLSYTVDNGVGTITISSSVAQWSYLTIIKNAEIA